MSAHDQYVLQMGGGLRWLAKRHGLKLREVTVLSTLILFDGMKGFRPTQETIAEASGTSRGVVAPALVKLEAAGLIRRETLRYLDSRRRECTSKNHVYILSEEIEQALEFAAETIELRRRATQPSLFCDDQMRATVDPIWIPDARDCQSDMDQVSPSPVQQTHAPDDQMRATVDPVWMPDARDCQSDMDQMRTAVDPYIGGGGGKKEQYMKSIRELTPTTPPTPEERDLSLQMMMHPAIAMPRDFAQAIAARWSPRDILGRCQAYSADYKAEGGAKGIGALIYRFAHFNSIPVREIRGEDSYDYEWYSEFEYLVGLQEGLYVPETEEEEPEPARETAYPAETNGPRPALVPAAALTDPETAEAVFNTMELPAHRCSADQEAWRAVVKDMAMELPEATYHTWLHGQTEFVRCKDDRFTIRTANAFVRDCLQMRLKKKMETALRARIGRSVEIEFLTSSQIVEEAKGYDTQDKPEKPLKVQAEQAFRPVLHPSGRS